MSNYDIEKAREVLTKRLRVLELIEQSRQKTKEAATSAYYRIFGNDAERHEAVERQNAVTRRLVSYFNYLGGAHA